jgi:hypothetical protein
MLTYEEKERLKEILNQLEDQPEIKNTQIDVSNRETREGKIPTERIVFRNQGGISIKRDSRERS